VVEEEERVYLRLNRSADVRRAATRLVTTDLLGRTKVSGLPYENADGSPLTVDTDYLGKKRSTTAPFAGPFENPGEGPLQLKVW
jgi:alpha-N-arabinofuranosidase